MFIRAIEIFALILKQQVMKFMLFVLITISSVNFTIAQVQFNNRAPFLGVDETFGTTILGNGLSFADFDGDGWDDITLTSGENSALRFYKNTNGLFNEVNLIVPAINYQTKSVTWVDIDNDGDKDLFVTSDTNGNRLYENIGSMSFQNITDTANLPVANQYTYGASWGDINNDGFLDVFVSNRIVTGNTITNYLYLNNGNKTFTDITVSAGLNTDSQLSFCTGFFDYNNDGFQDIYLANDKNFANILYQNNGDNTFTDNSVSSGAGVIMDAMSVTVDDVNYDGFLDIYVTNTPAPISNPGGNVFFTNNGDGTFTDIALSANVVFDSFAWGSVFLDADNDTDLDLYVSGSFDGTVGGFASAAFYENQGDNTFLESSSAGFVGDVKSSFANAIGDVDNDGKLDIIVFNNNDEQPFIWLNESITTNNYLAVTLEGTTSNRDGVGSLIEIAINGERQYRYVMIGEGYMAQNSLKEIFGLGTNTNVDYLKVKWLSGIEDIILNPAINEVIHIVEGSTLSIEESDTSQVVHIIPNPFNNQLNIKTNQKAIETIEICDSLGRLVYVERDIHDKQSLTIDTQYFSEGLYLCKISIQGIYHNLKLLKKAK